MPAEVRFLLHLRNLERPQIAFPDRPSAAQDQCEHLGKQFVAILLSTIKLAHGDSGRKLMPAAS